MFAVHSSCYCIKCVNSQMLVIKYFYFMILLLLYSLTSECVFSTRSVVINLGYKIESLEYLKYIYIHFVAHPEVIAILKNINNSDAQ